MDTGRMSRLDVSVVIPLYNDASTIGRCLESVLSQEYPGDRFEVIVVDNSSTDGSDRIAARHPVTVLYERDTLTSYAARNRGISAARGDIVVFTDSDCLPQPGWLRALVDAFEDDAVPAAGGPIEEAPPDSDIDRLVRELRPIPNVERLQGVYLPALVGGNAAYRRDLLLEAGMFNAELYTGGDLDLSWRVQNLAGHLAVFVPQAVVLHDHRSSLADLSTRYHRYGYCAALLTTIYAADPRYPENTGWHVRRTAAQIVALLTGVCAMVYRSFRLALGRGTRYEFMRPVVLVCVEWGALTGRLAGIWETRFFTRVPTYSGRRGV
jgi:glycosyltransferase involved in cell wall biosynthesis